MSFYVLNTCGDVSKISYSKVKQKLFAFSLFAILAASMFYALPLQTAFALPPTITITSPSSGAVLGTGSITVTGTASDPTGIQKVEVSVDSGSFSLATGTTSWSFTTGVLASGPHTIVAKATSNAGLVVTASVPVGNSPAEIAFNPSTNTIYVANKGSNTVSVIDGATNTVTATIPVGTAPHGIAVNPSTNTIYVTQGGISGSVSVINGATNTVTATIPVQHHPNAIAVNPSTNTIYVVNNNSGFGSGSVSVINGATNTVTATIPVGFYSTDIAFNPSTNTLYVVNANSRTVSVINGATNTVTANISGFAHFPSGVAVNPLTNTIYVSTVLSSSSGTISVINGATNSITTTIPIVGGESVLVGVNPSTNIIYVTNSISNTVSVINGATNTVTATIPVGATPFDVAVNPSTNTIYVSTVLSSSSSGTISVINEANNVATSSVSFTLQDDTTPPAAPTALDLTAASDTGSSDTDNITKDQTPNISGDAENGSTVRVYDGATLVATTTATSPWSVDTSILSDGQHTLTATATDAAGNTSPPSTPLVVTIDTVANAPTIDLTAASDTGSSDTDNITKDNTPNISGNTDETGTVALFSGLVSIGTASAASPWSTDTSLLADGVYSITAVLTDVAGNVSPASVALSVTIDTVANAPTIDLTAASDTGSSDTDNITKDNTPNISGNTDETGTVALFSGLVSIGTASAASPWSTDTSLLADGVYSITAVLTDVAGNVSPASVALSVTIDTTIPTLVTPAADVTFAAVGTSGAATVTFATSAFTDLNGLAPGSPFSSPTSGSILSVGLHTITHTAFDIAGNVATDTSTANVFDFVLETSSPININAGVFVLTRDEARDLDETVSETVQFRASSANGDTAARIGITVFAQATGPTDFTFRNAVNSLQFVEPATTNTAVNVGDGGYDDITFVYESTHGETKALRATTQVPGGSGRTVDADDPIRWSSDTFVIESTGAVKIFVASAQNNGVTDPGITATVESLTDPTPHEVTLTEDSPDAGTFTTPTRIILTATGPSDFTTDPANPRLHVSIATDEIIAKYPAISPTIEDRASIITPEIPVLGNVLVYTTAFTCGDGNDNDNDGLCNSWETQTRAVRGIKVDIGNGAPFSYPCRPLIDDTGVVNTGLYSTNQCPDPNKKDIYVEIDYMIGHKPPREALAKVIDAFRDSPISNGVDAFGTPRPTGATLHIQLDESLGFHRDVMPFDHEDNPFDPNDVLGFKQIKLQRFGLNTERNLVGQTADFIANSLTSKRQVFHYTQFIHLLEGRGTSSGYAELGGNDVVVSLGAFDNNVGTVDQQASTLMHELGHNLGLNHGGSINDEINCKPNYLSIMSYTFQFDDIVSLRELDFSRSALPTLVESALSESAGIGAIDANGITKSVYGPVTGVEPFTSRIVTGDLSSASDNPINWDRDEFSDESGIGLSINNIGIDGCTDSALDSLTGYDDWDSMALNFRPSDQFSDGRSTALGSIAERVVFNTAAGDDDMPGITSITAPLTAFDKTTAISPEATFEDGRQSDPTKYTATWNWGDGFTSPATVTTELADPDRDPNTREGEITLATGHNYENPGLYTLSLTLDDGEGNVVEQVWPFVIVVFDKTSTGSIVATASLNAPAGAFKVFNSAADSYTSDFTKTGNVEFKFQGQWQKNPQEAKINIVLDFKDGPLRFVGTSSEWVMITGNQGFFKGAGTINKVGDFGLVVSVVDGNLAGGNGIDKVRMRIFDPVIGDEHDLKAIVFDNMCTDPNDVYTPESCVRLYEPANDATITTSGTVSVKP